jgi:hypothetical protein
MKTTLLLTISFAVLLAALLAAKLVWTLHEPPAALDVGANSIAASDSDVTGVWEPDAGQEQLIARISLKQETAAALVRGEITLSEAAVRFRDVSGGDMASLSHLRNMYPQATDEELWYRQVIGYVRGFRASDPARVATLIPRLEAEVARLFPPRSPGSPQRHNARKANPMGAPQATQIRVSGPPRGRPGSHARPR